VVRRKGEDQPETNAGVRQFCVCRVDDGVGFCQDCPIGTGFRTEPDHGFVSFDVDDPLLVSIIDRSVDTFIPGDVDDSAISSIPDARINIALST
jgi:hypothetical protein